MKVLNQIINFFDFFKRNSITFSLIILTNIGGIAFGFYYYYGQFLQTPLYLIFFVPDSPFAVFLATLSLILYKINKRNKIIDVLAFISLIKIGIWTAFVLLLHADYYFTYEKELREVLFAVHIGMVFEAFVLLKGMKMLRDAEWLAILGWFLFNDYLDYWHGTHPILPEGNIEFVRNSTILMTFVFVGLAYLILKIKKEEV